MVEVTVTQECFCHKIDPTHGPCQVCTRASTAPDAEPVAEVVSFRAMECSAQIRWKPMLNGVPPLDVGTPLYTHPAEPVAHPAASVEAAYIATAEAAATHLKDKMRMREALTLALDLIQGTHEYEPSHPVVAKIIAAMGEQS